MIKKDKLMFKDQIEAAQKLFEEMPVKEILDKKPLLVAASLESVILVDYLARKLRLSYELLFAEEITAPNNKDCTIAMVSETEDIVIIDELVDSFNISLDYIYGEGNRKYEEKILKNIYKYRKGNKIGNLSDRDIILIDEGCETGLTSFTCLKSIIGLKAKSVSYATPLIANNVADNLNSITDQIYTVNNILNFVEVDFYYKEKIEVDSQKIVSILEESPYYLPLQKEGEKQACNIR
ncbi:putative phosphoribosyltransferase [Campylobacter blaseri]|uniref:Sodium:proton antiporter n=1 Tax=Campylobacter blaseri TaxID=2042961 RepID=A0A2P8R0B9_9BACT|nr:sodium:proton antiporter [Campylobacter blaseri]PSM51945.1 sodium:proton antiporter [Campylobacter blaseri]PSM53729.1 sodium:proton antiporter [Campylobacter blaseri]QKF85716.1 putative phosphoribosyltransferase [Campylobacter blaseri]